MSRERPLPILSGRAAEEATVYEVWYALAPDSGEAAPSGRQQYAEAISTLSLGITGLENGTFYHVWVKAKNTGGTSDFSGSVKESPKALSLTAPPVPEILEPEAGAKSVTVKWTPLAQADGYDVSYLHGTGEPVKAEVEGGDKGSEVISGLADDAAYYVWVSARNGAGSSGNSAVKAAATYKGGKAVLGFKVGDRQGIINESAKTIDLLSLPHSTNLAALTPVLTLSPDATVSPASNMSVDFSGGPVEFTVTAQNGDTQAYTARVTKKAQPSVSFNWISGAGFSDQASEALSGESVTLNAGNSGEEIAITGAFASYEWYVDNLLKGMGGSTNTAVTLPLAHGDYLPGDHRLDLIVCDEARVPYSTGLNFTVE